MTPFDRHPEDLLDRAFRAEASVSEMRELRAHTRVCVACSAHMVVGRKVANFLAPRAEDRMRDERAVVRTMSRFGKSVRRRRVRQI